MEEPTGETSRERAQAGPVGYLLVVGLTITMAISIVIFGGAVIQGSQGDSQIDQAELALTQFDSKVAQVALDESDSQRVQLGRGGDYRVDEEAGKVRLYHDNWTEGETEYIYGNDTEMVPLGSVIYEQDDTQIAYQAGGVWRKDDDGSKMVSPPEFQYRGATLTFPIIRVTGADAGSGDIHAHVTRSGETRAVFSDPAGEMTPLTEQYDASRSYENPVENGTMVIEIQSEYCDAWRRYFQERTEGEVSECDSDGLVTAELISLGSQGEFDPIGGGTLEVRGQEEDGLSDFSITFRHQDSEASEFNNLGWSMSAEEGDKEFEISVQRQGGSGSVEPGDPVNVNFYYSNDSGETYEGWQNDDGFVAEMDESGLKVHVDFMSDNTSEWSELSGSDLEEFNPGDQGSRPSDLNDPAPTGNITQYYFDQMGDMDLKMNEQNNANLGDSSTGTIFYDGAGHSVTYLHVTENSVEIRLRS